MATVNEAGASASEVIASATTAEILVTSSSRSRPLIRIKRTSRGRTKLLGLTKDFLRESTQSATKKVIELLKTPKNVRVSYFDKRRKFMQAKTKFVAIKTKKIYPNTTSCAKNFLKLDPGNPKASQFAKCLVSAFTPKILADFTDEYPVLGKLKRARQNGRLQSFQKGRRESCPFFPISSISKEGILLVDDRSAIPELPNKTNPQSFKSRSPGSGKNGRCSMLRPVAKTPQIDHRQS